MVYWLLRYYDFSTKRSGAKAIEPLEQAQGRDSFTDSLGLGDSKTKLVQPSHQGSGGRTTQFANSDRDDPNVGRFVAADSDFMILPSMILPNRLSAIRGGPRKSLEIVTASSSWPASSCPVSFCQLLGF